jgi:hypothetical protein
MVGEHIVTAPKPSRRNRLGTAGGRAPREHDNETDPDHVAIERGSDPCSP